MVEEDLSLESWVPSETWWEKVTEEDLQVFREWLKKAKQIRWQIAKRVKKNKQVAAIWNHFLKNIKNEKILAMLFEFYWEWAEAEFLHQVMAPFVGFADGRQAPKVNSLVEFANWIKSSSGWQKASKKLNPQQFAKFLKLVSLEYDIGGVRGGDAKIQQQLEEGFLKELFG